MNKFNIIIFLLTVLTFQACSKGDRNDVSLFIDMSKKPVFYTVLNIGGQRDSLVAGRDDYYMFSNFTSKRNTAGNLSWLVFQGNLRRVSCGTVGQNGSTCSRDILFEFFNTQAGTKLSATALASGKRTYSQTNSLDSVLPVQPLVRLRWVDETNRSWDTEYIPQPPESYFIVEESLEYSINEQKLPTRLLRVRFSCMIGHQLNSSSSTVVERCFGEGIVAVSYPTMLTGGGGSMSQ